MGDRVSISFSMPFGNRGERETSPTLFSHWGGMDLVYDAYAYVRELKKEVAGKHCEPLERLEPRTVIVDFIRHITARQNRIMSNYYLGKDDSDGDNSDNGHHDIRMDEVE